MAKRTLGIDIQHDGLAWVIVRAGIRHVDIEKSGWIPFPNGQGRDSDLPAALSTLKEDINPSGMTCVAALSGRDIVCRTSQVPFRDRKKIRQILPLDLEPTLPMPVEDLVIDFQLTATTVPTILTAALARSRRDTVLAALRAAGFDPEILTFRGMSSAFLAARHLTENDTSMLVDGDQEHCLFFLIRNGCVTHIRNWTLPLAEGHLEATLARGIHQTLAAFSDQSERPVALETVYLTAAAAGCYDRHQLGDDVEGKVSTLALREVTAANITGGWPEERCQEALALCLYAPQAEKGLNFYRTTFPLQKIILQNKAHCVRAAVLGVLLAGLFMTDVALDIRRSRTQLHALNQTAHEILTATFPATRNVVDPLQQMIVKLRESRGEASVLTGGHAGPRKVDLLNELSRAMPPQLDIHLSQLVAGEEQLQLSGTTDTFEAVNQAKSSLEKQALFQKLTIVSANMDPTTERVRFKLRADYTLPSS
jgi:general secretion pathway protein L